MISMSVSDGGEANLVDKGIQHRRNAVPSVEKDAMGFVKHPRGDQRGGEQNYAWGIHEYDRTEPGTLFANGSTIGL